MSIIVLEEGGERQEPSEVEVRMYASYIGIELEKEPHLKWIARKGLVAPVPNPWKACTANDLDVFYFNSETGESTWHHPCDQIYRNMVEEYRANHITTLIPVGAAKVGMLRSSVSPFLPSRAMKTELNGMWCFPIMEDGALVAKIQSNVEARYGAYLHLRCVPFVFPIFPGFMNILLNYIKPTQKDIDDAWLDDALDLLGRPAMCMFDADMEDDQHMSSTGLDYQEEGDQTFSFDGASYHRSFFTDADVASSHQSAHAHGRLFLSE